jgi:hypothetical protein
MTLRELLRKNRSAIIESWRDYALSDYQADATVFFRSQKDRFANPVGHALRSGTEAIFDGLLDEMSAEQVCACLDDIIKARAIQDLSPSQAVSFVFDLKRAIRKEIGGEIADPRTAAELAQIDAQIDQIALFAFDVYTRCREKVAELRINEVKRNVAGVMERLGVKMDPPADGDEGAGDAGLAQGGGR